MQDPPFNSQASLIERLDTVAARANRLRWATAVARVLAGAAAYFAVLTLVDRGAALPLALRGVGLVALAAATLWVLAGARRREQAVELARRAAGRWPAEGEDVLCALDLHGRKLHSRRQDDEAPQLVEAALARIEERTATLDFDALLDRRGLRRGAVAAATAVLALVALWAASPSAMATAARRVLTLSDAPYPTRTRIVSINPGAARLADPTRPVTVVARAEGELPELGRLEVRTRTGIELRTELERRGAGEYQASLPHLREDYRYRVALGDARSEAFEVVVVPRPEVELALEVTPPAGFADEPRRFEGNDAARAVEGSALTVVLRSTKPLSEVRAGALAFELTAEGARCGPLELWEPLALELAIADRDGLAPEDRVRLNVRIDPDQRPAVELLTDADVLTMRAAGTLRLPFRATDDGSITALALHVEPFSSAGDGARAGEALEFELPLAGEPRATIEAVAEVALADFGAALDSRWQCWIVAVDGRARGPNRSSSTPVTVRVVDDERFAVTLEERIAEAARHHVQRFRLEQVELAAELGESIRAGSELRSMTERQRALGQRVLAFAADGLGPMREWLGDNALESGPAAERFRAFEGALVSVGARAGDDFAAALERAPDDAHALQRVLTDELLALVQQADPSIVVAELAQSLETLVRMQQDTTRAAGARLRYFAGLGPMVEAAPTDSFDAIRRAHEGVARGYSALVDELGASLRVGGADEAIARCARTGLDAGVLARLGGLSTLFELGAKAERDEDERVALLNATYQSLRDVLRGMALQLIELAPGSPLAVNVLMDLAEERDLRRGAGSAGVAGGAGSQGETASDARTGEAQAGEAQAGEAPPPGEVVADAESPNADLPEPTETGPELERQERGDLSEEAQKKKFEEFDPVHQRDLAKLPGRQTDQLLEKKQVAEELESTLNEQAQLERQMASMDESSSESARSEIEDQLRQQEESLSENLGGEEDPNAQNALQNARDARQAFNEGRDEDARQHQRQAMEFTLATYVNELTPQRQERDSESGTEAPPPGELPPEDENTGGAADDETGRVGGGLLVEIRPTDEEGDAGPEPEPPPLPDEGVAPARVWVLDLPPSLREHLRLENPATAPPGYERRLQSYFQSFDRDRDPDED